MSRPSGVILYSVRPACSYRPPRLDKPLFCTEWGPKLHVAQEPQKVTLFGCRVLHMQSGKDLG